MSYCLNPACSKPINPDPAEFCQACGVRLLLRDRYRVAQVLGRGGFGTTFLAIDTCLPGTPSCVIKQLRPVVSTPHVLQMARELFHREATTLGKIGNHPQLPRLLDFFELGQEFYLVQEYVSGSTLQQEVRREGPLNEEATKTVLREVLPLLDYLHGNEVIHRDIKPANLIRRNIDNRLVLIDFGAVKDQVSSALLVDEEEGSALTAFAVGTPGFAPPEQMAMRPVYASDLYALGVTCLYLLTGKSPKDLSYDQTTGELLWQNCVQVSDHFRAVLEKMLQPSVRYRYQTADELLRVLELESHFSQLNQSLATPVQSYAGGPSTPAAKVASPAARHASAIRSQQARLEVTSRSSRGSSNKVMVSHRNQTQYSQDFGELSQGSSSGPMRSRIPTKPKLDAAGLITTYRRGQRDFSQQYLSHLILRKVCLEDAVFHQAQLQNVDLRGANLGNAHLGRATLTQANLRDCNLKGAYLGYADLGGADLRGADLSNAYLNNANLRGANLCGANLLGASVTEEQLSLAQTNWRTRR